MADNDPKSSKNDEIEAQLDKLTEHCHDAVAAGESTLSDVTDALLRALLMSGFEHSPGGPLSAQLETRLRQRYQEPAMHRGAELKAVTEQVQKRYTKIKRWQSDQPGAESSPKTANISSSTDS